MQFDKTITLGHLLIIVSMLVGAAGTYTAIKLDVNKNTHNIQSLETRIKRFERVARWVQEIKTDMAVIKKEIGK